MKSNNILKAAILTGLLGIAGTAQAVNVNYEGHGQVLLYPYYTTNGGNDTLISIGNSTDEAKAVKVRFMESQNSREVLDFNLYLSAHDMWVGAVTKIEGVPTLIIPDTSCTTPYLYPAGKQPFLPWALNDGGSTSISRTAEGHMEVIEMGTLVGDSAQAATHVIFKDGTVGPLSCETLNKAWTNYDNDALDGYWITDPLVDMEAPSGGLFGSAAVVNVGRATLYSYDATALNSFATEVGQLHQVPGTPLPSLNSGDVLEGKVFLEDGSAYYSSEFSRGVDAVSFVLMQNQIFNEFVLDESIAAETEWVVTFPTKSFYTDAEVVGEEPDLFTAWAPFTERWEGKGACETVMIDAWDREEATGEDDHVIIPPIVSPPPPKPTPTGTPQINLCYETNVISFNDSNIFASPKATKLETDFENGWMRFDFESYYDSEKEYEFDRLTLSGLIGLPVLAFSASEYSNGTVSHYNNIFKHKTNRKIYNVQ